MSSWVSRELVTGLRSAVLLRILVSGVPNKHREDGLQAYVTKVCIRDVANENPSNFEDTLPLVRCPDSTTPCIINLTRRREGCGEIRKTDQRTGVSISAIPQK